MQTNSEEVDWDEIKNSNLDIFVTSEDFKEILEKIDYKVDETGVVLDNETHKLVKSEDNQEINIKQDNELMLITGSHIFAKNIAGLSQVLAEKGLLKFNIKEEKE